MKIGSSTLISAGGSDIFVAKFDPKGNVLWAQQYGDVGFESAGAIAVDPSGDVVITGSADDAVDFGGGPVSAGIFVVKLDPSGKLLWSTSCGGATGSNASAGGRGVALDGGGEVVLAGSFQGTANCGDTAHVSSGKSDILLAKLSGMDGHALWTKAFADATNQWSIWPSGVAVDAKGNIAMTGAIHGTVSFGGANLSGPGMFLARFSSSGAPSWSWARGNAFTAGGVAMDSLGQPVLVGSYAAAGLDLGGATLPSSNGAFAAKFDASGATVWSEGFASSSTIRVGGVAVDPADNLAFGGYGSTDFGGGQVDASSSPSSAAMARTSGAEDTAPTAVPPWRSGPALSWLPASSRATSISALGCSARPAARRSGTPSSCNSRRDLSGHATDWPPRCR